MVGARLTSALLSTLTGSAFWCLLDMMPIKNETGEVVLFLFSFKDITQSGGPGLGPPGIHGDSNHGDCRLGWEAERVLCPGSPETSAQPTITPVLPPTENSLGRRGASSKPRSARRQSRTVLHRLTGRFNRRGQGSMKTSNVSPIASRLDCSAVSLVPCLPGLRCGVVPRPTHFWVPLCSIYAPTPPLSPSPLFPYLTDISLVTA